MSKGDIEKIDEHIQDILNSEKKEESTSFDSEHFEEELKSDTKKIKNLDELEDIQKDFLDDEDTEEIDQIESFPKENKEIDVKHDVEMINSSVSSKNVSPKKKNGRNKIFFWFLLLLFVVVAFFLFFLIFFKSNSKISSDSSDNKEKLLSKEEQQKVLNGYGDALKGILAVYYDKQNVLLEYDDAVRLVDYDFDVACKEHEIYDDGSLYLNQCSIDQHKISFAYGKTKIKELQKMSMN